MDASSATIINGALIAVATLGSVSLAAYLTYRYARKASRLRHETEIQVDHLKRDIGALEKVWELLPYISPRESEKSIVIWRQEPGSKDKRYMFQYDNLKSFLFEEMDRVFYVEHAGLHLPPKIKTMLFDYCGNLMGLYMKYHKEPPAKLDEPIEIENEELVKKLNGLYEALNEELRTQMQKRYDSLLLTDS